MLGEVEENIKLDNRVFFYGAFNLVDNIKGCL